MLAFLITAIHSSIGHGVLTGFGAAIAIDIHTFLSWQSWHDAAAWDWRRAILRWLQGIVYGGLTAAGLGALGA